jgi:hypothetical protein
MRAVPTPMRTFTRRIMPPRRGRGSAGGAFAAISGSRRGGYGPIRWKLRPVERLRARECVLPRPLHSLASLSVSPSSPSAIATTSSTTR